LKKNKYLESDDENDDILSMHSKNSNKDKSDVESEYDFMKNRKNILSSSSNMPKTGLQSSNSK